MPAAPSVYFRGAGPVDVLSTPPVVRSCFLIDFSPSSLFTVLRSAEVAHARGAAYALAYGRGAAYLFVRAEREER